MPSLEENPKPLQAVQSTDTVQQQPPLQEPIQPRELTQTDLLNNRLLKSFLNRMNTGDIVSKLNNETDNQQTPDEFDD